MIFIDHPTDHSGQSASAPYHTRLTTEPQQYVTTDDVSILWLKFAVICWFFLSYLLTNYACTCLNIALASTEGLDLRRRWCFMERSIEVQQFENWHCKNFNYSCLCMSTTKKRMSIFTLQRRTLQPLGFSKSEWVELVATCFKQWFLIHRVELRHWTNLSTTTLERSKRGRACRISVGWVVE